MNGVVGDYADSEMAPMVPDAEPSLKEDGSSQDTNDYLATQKLIYKCNMTIETLTFNDTVASIKDSIKTHGGFIESDELSDDSWDWYYTSYEKRTGTLYEKIVIRVPATKYNDFLKELEGKGKVLTKTEQVTNITKQYNDTQTMVQAYQKEQAMLLEMMDKATTISEMITVEERLATVNRQLALYQSQLSGMDTDIAFSTITVTIKEVVEYTRVVEEKNFVQRVWEAITDSADSFIEFLEGALIFVIYVLPYIVIIGAIVFTIVFIKRKRRKGKPYTIKAKTEVVENKGKEQNEENKEQ
jgi:hypothetical protein